MQGIITIGGNGISSILDKDLNINDEEQVLAEHFIGVIKQDHPELDIIVERRSQNYLSLCLNSFDFMRFKYSDRAKWITIFNYGLDENDPRFVAQKNKRQSHWKANIKDLESLSDFDSDAIEACLCGVDQ